MYSVRRKQSETLFLATGNVGRYTGEQWPNDTIRLN